MAVPSILVPALKDVVHELVHHNFQQLEADGRAGRLTAGELQLALLDYGRTLVELPNDALAVSRSYPLEGVEQTWRVDLALWTAEEGRSDLTLSLTARVVGGEVVLEIDDLHVL